MAMLRTLDFRRDAVGVRARLSSYTRWNSVEIDVVFQ
jgi:hypothetical protein